MPLAAVNDSIDLILREMQLEDIQTIIARFTRLGGITANPTTA